MKLKTVRLEALTDGIFAIVMTVMMVSFSEVLNFANPVKDIDFWNLFLSFGHDFIAFAASFLILGVLWLEHHRQFNLIKHIDPVLVVLNIAWFMFVCLIPFSTMFLGDYHNFFAPWLIFELNILIVFLILQIHWVYASYKYRLIDASVDKNIIARHKRDGFLLIITVLSVIAVTVLCKIIVK